MDIKTLLLLVLTGACVAMAGCQPQVSTSSTPEKAPIKGLHIFKQEKDSINLELLIEDYPQGFDGYLYILYSECSYCISTFLNFAKELEEAGYQGNVIVLISEDTRPIINHYLKEKNLVSKLHFILKENKNDIWKIGSNEAENGKVYNINNQDIKETYIYLPEE